MPRICVIRRSELIKYADQARALIGLRRNLAQSSSLVFDYRGRHSPSAQPRKTLETDCAEILAKHNQAAREAGIRDFDLTMEQLFEQNEGKYVYE